MSRKSGMLLATLSFFALTVLHWGNQIADGQTENRVNPAVEIAKQLHMLGDKVDQLSRQLTEPKSDKNSTEESRPSNVAKEMKAWLTDAKDSLHVELEKKTNEYSSWRENENVAWQFEHSQQLALDKLVGIESRLTETEEALEEARIRADLLQTRLETLRKNREQQLTEIRALLRFRDLDQAMADEIKRLEKMYAALVQKLADVDLLEQYAF